MLSMKRMMYAVMAAVLLSGCAGTVEKTSETAFFPPLPQQPRLQFLVSITAEEDIGGGKKTGAMQEWLVGKRPSAKQIGRPHDFASTKGKIYISDRGYKKVLFIDLEKKAFDFIKDEREGSLGDPLGMWVTEDDVKYVVDSGRKQVVVYGQDNQFVRAYGEPEQFDRPMDVAVYQDRIYVVDFAKMAVVVLDKDSGKTVQTLAGPGNTEGKLNRPTHISLDRQGNLYVNDSFNFRVQKFDPNGNYLKHFGYLGDTLGGFARPKGIAVDKGGFLYAVDTAFENTQIFDPESAEILLFFGGYGPHTGSMYMPSALHIDYDNVSYFQQYVDKDFKIEYLVYVGNLLGDKKINVYGFGEWIGAPLPVVERRRVPAPAGGSQEENAANK